MSIRGLFCFILLFLLHTANAGAAITEKSGVRADLPEGWSMTESQGGNDIIGSSNVVIHSPQKTAQIIVSIFRINESGSELLAVGTSERLNGTTPKAVDGGYVFSFSLDSTTEDDQPLKVTGKTFVSGKDKMLGTITCAGQAPPLKEVLNSLQGSTPELQELLDVLRPGFRHITE